MKVLRALAGQRQSPTFNVTHIYSKSGEIKKLLENCIQKVVISDL